MRKINTILSVLLVVIFLLHGLMGSALLLGIENGSAKMLARFGVIVLLAHIVIGIVLTVKSLQISKDSGDPYLKENAVFWARRASGFAILITLFFHFGVFGAVQDGVYVLFPFTTVKLLTQLLLVAAVFTHLSLNVRPILVSLGIVSDGRRRGVIYFVLSLWLLLCAGALIMYYIGWQI